MLDREEQVLFAAEEHPQLLPLILRKFSSDGDVETAQRLVQSSRGIERTRELAASHAQLAMDAVR
jgi:geranylgeranyl pyrophosphate synthase